mmetsp:Transcript_22887/g.35201  ORF Transcript_22887/g.35201 Transcript_22887/m.35201 type:complete len:91 (-) Transcript_22887:415-687(-)
MNYNMTMANEEFGMLLSNRLPRERERHIKNEEFLKKPPAHSRFEFNEHNSDLYASSKVEESQLAPDGTMKQADAFIRNISKELRLASQAC